jgi:hypothetical protein
MARFRLDLGPRRVERNVDAELNFHLDMRTRRLVERGMEPAAARSEALRQFGDLSGVRAELVALDTQQEKIVRRTNSASPSSSFCRWPSGSGPTPPSSR